MKNPPKSARRLATCRALAETELYLNRASISFPIALDRITPDEFIARMDLIEARAAAKVSS